MLFSMTVMTLGAMNVQEKFTQVPSLIELARKTMMGTIRLPKSTIKHNLQELAFPMAK